MDHETVIALLPARFASKRFPGKLIADIGGVSVLKRTYDQVVKCGDIDELYVVTSDEILKDHCATHDIPLLFVKGDYICGSDRCMDAYKSKNLEGAVLLNVQAEQPFIKPDILSALIAMMKSDNSISIGSLMSSAQCTSEDPNVVKVSIDESGFAQSFSRMLNPSLRSHQHIGVYGFRTEVLPDLMSLSPSSGELEHKLEQLRWMEHDYKIKMLSVDHNPVSIDTPSQLLKANSYDG